MPRQKKNNKKNPHVQPNGEPTGAQLGQLEASEKRVRVDTYIRTNL